MSDSVRILYVDDSRPSLEIRTRLLNEFDEIEVSTAAGAAEGLTRLQEAEFDCVLSDLDMPARRGFDVHPRSGLEFLEAVRERDPDLPFILFTTHQTGDLVREAIEANVTDYVVKDYRDGFYELLVHRIQQFVDHHHAKKRLNGA